MMCLRFLVAFLWTYMTVRVFLNMSYIFLLHIACMNYLVFVMHVFLWVKSAILLQVIWTYGYMVFWDYFIIYRMFFFVWTCHFRMIAYVRSWTFIWFLCVFVHMCLIFLIFGFLWLPIMCLWTFVTCFQLL